MVILACQPISSDLVQDQLVNLVKLWIKVFKIQIIFALFFPEQLFSAERIFIIHVVVLERVDQRSLELRELNLR